MPLSTEQRAHLEELLLRERARVVKHLATYAEQFGTTPHAPDGDLSAFAFHIADEGTDTMDRETAFLLAGEEGRRLQEIDRALRRLYREPDKYGCCEACGRDIGFERLEALPYATLCIECKTGQET